jgi:GNAT superfamily N-acetyltransferase
MTWAIRALSLADLAPSQQLLSDACDYDNVLDIAEEKLFAPGAGDLGAEPLGAFVGQTLVGVACTSSTWLRLLAIAPGHRGGGLGDALLHACEAQIAAHGTHARTLDQPGNYLSPGIDVRNREFIAWLEKRGYKPITSACNLLLRVDQNPLVCTSRLEQLRERCEQQGYTILRQPPARLQNDVTLVEESFSSGWAFEMRRAHTRSNGVHIAIETATGAFAGFAAHDGNNAGRGWFGPTGTLLEHRSRGLGAALLMACLLDVRDAGHSHCQVAWIGPRGFYDKIAGIDSERHFTVLRKELT